MRSNYKVIWISPNEANPLRYREVTPLRSVQPSTLIGSMAESTGSNILNHAGGRMITPSKLAVEIPQTGTMTVEQALNRRKSYADSLNDMVNKDASLMEQAFQAVSYKSNLKLAARNAMEDGNAAVQMSMTVPDRTFAEMLANRADDYSGDALYRKVIDDAVLELKGLCFAAGTLIHTKDGLVPIENIKVGDWVLSQPEETGERVYKRVVKTVAFEDKPVWTVEISLKDEFDKACKEKRLMPEDATTRLVVTQNHPFWVENKGWTQVDALRMDDVLQLADGSVAVVNRAFPLYPSEVNGVAWAIDYGSVSWGHLIDLRHGVPEGNELGAYVAAIDEVDFDDDTTQFKCTVYNMEVEDTHTYYVGTWGVWVHNTDCAELAARKAAAMADEIIPSSGLGLYFPRGESEKFAPPHSGVILAVGWATRCPPSHAHATYFISNLGFKLVGNKLPTLRLKGLCFAAGTLIHTKDGLVPIENIKVGDWVLSQPEETGERVYKRVVKTVAFEDKPVWQVTYFSQESLEAGDLRGQLRRLVVTANHPFWVVGKGWTRVDELEFLNKLEFADGLFGMVDGVLPLYRSDTDGVAWVPRMADPGRVSLLI